MYYAGELSMSYWSQIAYPSGQCPDFDHLKPQAYTLPNLSPLKSEFQVEQEWDQKYWIIGTESLDLSPILASLLPAGMLKSRQESRGEPWWFKSLSLFLVHGLVAKIALGSVGLGSTLLQRTLSSRRYSISPMQYRLCRIPTTMN